MIAVAFLRGINVGGNAKTSMAQLKLTFERIGLENVSTYINSGNVIFETSRKDFAKLTSEIEEAIKKDFGFHVPVVIRSQESLEMLVAKIPEYWQNNTEVKTDVMFLWDAARIEDLPVIKGIDNVMYEPGAVVWHVTRENQSKSGILKIIGSHFYKNMTARNVNTLRKLVEIMQK